MAFQWQEAYRLALKSQPRDSLVEAIRVAEAAINSRLQEIEGSTEPGHGTERASLNTALKDLAAIKTRGRLP